MAFPVLLLHPSHLASTVECRLNDITFRRRGRQPGVFTLVMVIGLLRVEYYPARIVRAQILSLREKEFVEAARMVGGSDWRIIRSHLLPHLVAPIIVYSTLIVAQNILLEAGLSFLGVGIQLPTASWGNLLATAPDYYLAQPWLTCSGPGLAVLLTTPRLQPPRRRSSRRVRPAPPRPPLAPPAPSRPASRARSKRGNSYSLSCLTSANQISRASRLWPRGCVCAPLVGLGGSSWLSSLKKGVPIRRKLWLLVSRCL